MAMFSEAPREFTASDIPAPQIVDPKSVPSYRWGFIGAGDIAEVMAAALAKHTNQRVVAVGSQTPGKGKAFAERFGIERHYDNYADLANDPEVDIVYVATLPHTHLADASIVMDMGIYPISFAQMVLGSPSRIIAGGKMHNENVEAMAAAILEYDSGARAVLATSGHSHIPTIASITGDAGVLTLDGPFFIPTALELRPALFNSHGPRWSDESGVVAHEGLSYQATYMAKFISEGLLESPLHTHSEVVEGIRIGEEIRRQVGVVYP